MAADEADDFQAVYLHYRETVLEELARDVKDVFQQWRQAGYWSDYKKFEESAIPSPTYRATTRAKRYESVLDKFRRMPNEFPGEPSEANLRRLRDAFGARVIVYFSSQLAMLDMEIRSGRHFELSTEHPPKSYVAAETLDSWGLSPRNFAGAVGKKNSGYASLHYVVRLKLRSSENIENPWFELQTRTMLEEVWGEVEHQVAYKPDTRTSFSVKRQFKVISEHLSALDGHFDFLYNEVAFQQAASRPNDDDVLNAENLPHVLNEIECIVQQREISGLLRILRDHNIETVGALAELGRLDLVEAIKAELQRIDPTRTATAFDVIPVLITLPRNATTDDARKRLRLQVDIAERQRREP